MSAVHVTTVAKWRH